MIMATMIKTALLIVIVGTIPALPARAVCVDHDRYRLDYCGGVSLAYGLGDVAVSGNHAYVASTRDGLHICDVSGAGVMARLQTLSLPGVMHGVAVSGNFVYVVGEGALHVVDATIPGAAVRWRTLALTSTAVRAEVSGHVLCLAMTNGMSLYDITDPGDPVAAGGIGGGATDVAMADGFVYVVGANGLTVVDARTAGRPAALATLSVPGHTARCVAVDWPYVYVAGYFQGIDVIDVRDPGAPRLVAQVEALTFAWPEDIELMGTLLLVGCGQGSLGIFDVSDPLHPWGGRYGLCCYAAGLAVSGDRVFTAGIIGNFNVQRVSPNPGVPIIGSAPCPAQATGLDAFGDLVCIAGGDRGLWLFDVTDPGSPVLLGSLATPGSASDVAVRDAVAWVADSNRGLQAVDIGDPAHPRLLGAVDTPGFARRVSIEGNLAYVADGGAGLAVIDISFPEEPRLVGAVDTHGYAMDVAISGTRALVADYGSGMAVIDISDTSSPRLLTEVDTAGEAWGVAILGSTAFIADGANGVCTFSLNGPEFYALRRYSLAGYACALTRSGNDLYVAGWEAGVHVIARPAPSYIDYVRNRLATPGAARDVAVTAKGVFVADIGFGLQVLPAHCESVADVSDPAPVPLPRRLAVHPNPMADRVTARMTLTRGGPVQAAVYDLAGRRVREFLVDPGGAADCDVTWDGRDASGRSAAAGLYFLKVRTPDGEAVGRIVRLR